MPTPDTTVAPTAVDAASTFYRDAQGPNGDGLIDSQQEAPRPGTAAGPEYVYLASPYSHPDPAVREARFDAALQAAADLMRRGASVFAPIAHSHPIAATHDMPGDWGFWEGQDIPLLHHAAKLYVLTLDGWEESRGVAAEVAYARAAGKPITYLAP